MATKVVVWLSENRLPCACRGTVDVILCTIWDVTVPASLIASSSTSSCETGNWKYDLQYDSDDLPEDVTALSTSDITGVLCEGCLTSWVREQFAAPASYSVALTTPEYDVDFTTATNGDTDEGLTLSVTNPSSTQNLVGMVAYDYQVNISALGEYAVGAQADLFADGVIQANTRRRVYSGYSASEGTTVFQAGTSCFLDVTIPPGETVDFHVRFTAEVSVLASSSFTVAFGQLGFHGSTTTT